MILSYNVLSGTRFLQNPPALPILFCDVGCVLCGDLSGLLHFLASKSWGKHRKNRRQVEMYLDPWPLLVRWPRLAVSCPAPKVTPVRQFVQTWLAPGLVKLSFFCLRPRVVFTALQPCPGWCQGFPKSCLCLGKQSLDRTLQIALLVGTCCFPPEP